jgi:hypothetical protein
VGLSDRINEKTVELIKNEKCKVSVTDEGKVKLDCEAGESELSSFDVNLVAGVSKIVEKQKDKKESEPVPLPEGEH